MKNNYRIKSAKTGLYTALLASLIAAVSQPLQAGGIPTVDPAAISAQIQSKVETLAQLAKELDALNQQIEQAKQYAQEQAKRFEGNWNLGSIANNDDFLNSLPSEAKDTLLQKGSESLDSLRQKYGLKTDNAEHQKDYDALLSRKSRVETAYKNTQNRIKKLNEIRKLADRAKTPAEKQDVANKLALEQLYMQQEQVALQQLEQQAKFERETEAEKSKADFFKKLDEAKKSFKARNG